MKHIQWLLLKHFMYMSTAWSVQIRSFSGPYFAAFGLNTERYPYPSVFRPNARKYRPEKTPYLDTFQAVCPYYEAYILKRRTNWNHLEQAGVSFQPPETRLSQQKLAIERVMVFSYETKKSLTWFFKKNIW